MTLEFNNIIIGIIIGLLAIYFFNYNKKEYIENISENVLENISENDRKILDALFEYFTSNKFSNYFSYLQFLEKIQNTNLEIINEDTFCILKAFQKRNILTKDDILKEMKLM